MIHASAPALPDRSELAGLVGEHLDDLVTYAAHLVGDVGDAIEFTAGGVYHATKYPPARLQVHGTAALYRAVTRACRQGQRFPPRTRGLGRFLHRRRPIFHAEFEGAAAGQINTVKRALLALPFERRAALLLRDLAKLSYAEMARVMECSPEASARLLARSRREFGTVYREIKT